MTALGFYEPLEKAGFADLGVIIAMNDEGGTNAFCRFSDGSLLSLDGLWHW